MGAPFDSALEEEPALEEIESVELKQEQPVLEEPEEEYSIQEPANVEVDAVEVEDIKVVPEPATVEAEVNQRKSKAKSKNKKVARSREGSLLSLEQLQVEIQKSPLSGSEVQQVIDILLAKQNELDQWHTPGQKSDPSKMLHELKKHNEELEAQLNYLSEGKRKSEAEMRQEITQKTNE